MPAIVKSILPIAKGQQAIGTTSLLAPLATNRKTCSQRDIQKKRLAT